MTRLRGLALAGALCLLGGCDDDGGPPPVSTERPGPAEPPAPASGALAVEVTAGEVRLERGGVLLVPGSGMVRGDVLVTGSGGSARLTLPDGREVEVGANARLRLGGESGGVLLEVGRGVVLTRVPRAEKSAGGATVVLELKTPFGLVRLGNHSEAQVDADSGRIEVRLGSVAFVGAGGERLEAREGERVVAAAGGVARVEPATVMVLAPLEVVLRSGNRGVEIRRQGSALWRAAPAGEATLTGGDALRARRGSAVLAVGKVEVELERGGEVRFDAPAGPGPAAGSPALDLARGTLTLRATEGVGQRISVGGVSLESQGPGLAQVRRTPSGLLVDVVTGSFALSRGEEQRQVVGGSQAVVATGGALAVSALAAPALRLPASRWQRVLHEGLDAVALGWEHPGPVQVEVAAEAEFARPLLTGRVEGGFVRVAAPARGALYWRVKDLAGAEVAQGSATFAPERKQRAGQVKNEIPEGAQATTVYFQSQLPTLTFVHGGEEGAARYRFQLFREGELAAPLIERSVDTTRLALEPGALPEGSYLWSVTPLDAAGKAMRGARMSRLLLAYDNAVPDLVVESPRAGARVRAGEELRVVGISPVGGRVRVNGKPMSQDDKGRFDGRARASGSPPCIIFELSRPGVPDTFTVRVLRPRS